MIEKKIPHGSLLLQTPHWVTLVTQSACQGRSLRRRFTTCGENKNYDRIPSSVLIGLPYIQHQKSIQRIR